MMNFTNPVGSGTLWFHNLTIADETPVAYDPQARAFVPMPPFCANRDVIGCNWIAPEEGAFCRSCAMTALAPDPEIPNAIDHWAETESAKRWVIDNLGRWHWFRPEDPGTRPVFHMLADGNTIAAMGHGDGVVTISVSEADPVVRVSRREALDELNPVCSVPNIHHALALVGCSTAGQDRVNCCVPAAWDRSTWTNWEKSALRTTKSATSI